MLLKLAPGAEGLFDAADFGAADFGAADFGAADLEAAGFEPGLWSFLVQASVRWEGRKY